MHLAEAKIQPDKLGTIPDAFWWAIVTIGTIGYWLIGLHAVAALFHHYLMRDNTLLRMLPRRGRA